ncbi:MAG: RNA polymerase sigma factor [Planctomycetes bacterium]|nr:RNA polymerase sigma factor [Planctomycetota bacterium]
MFGKTVSYGVLWDFAVSEAVSEDQRWILSTMQKHGQEIVTMLWRILGNEQDVCDAYQDTFLQLAHYEGGQKPEHVKAYIFRAANNVAISMLRRRIAQRKRMSTAIGTGKHAAEWRSGEYRPLAGSPAKELDSKYLQETLRCCIAQLPEHLRNVITLRDLAELSYAQIGRILGISAGTARVYRCKALQILVIWMEKEE